jgi:two-component sensor histidine kinase
MLRAAVLPYPTLCVVIEVQNGRSSGATVSIADPQGGGVLRLKTDQVIPNRAQSVKSVERAPVHAAALNTSTPATQLPCIFTARCYGSGGLNVGASALPVAACSAAPVLVEVTLTSLEDVVSIESAYQTEIRKLEERLVHAVRETHHRVKNSLQVLLALLELPAIEGCESVPVTEVIRLKRHIHALAAIHDLLTPQPNAKVGDEAEVVAFRSVMEALWPLVKQTVGARSARFEIDDVSVSPQQATALAFIINELISNALRHGCGEIKVILNVHVAAREMEVTVRDEGTGFPDIGRKPHQKTGLELVEHLARWDLRGRVRYENLSTGGACVKIQAPL